MSVAQANGEIASSTLEIRGVALEVTPSITAQINVPASVQTTFAGKQNGEAPVIPDLLAAAELTGPGITTPIELRTTPGHAFQIPALSTEGEYILQNIRLTKNGSQFLQHARPAFATIHVANVFQTEVKIRQLSADELRARGITVDERNFEVYEYTFVFATSSSQRVEIPYPVIIDKRTREVVPIQQESRYFIPRDRATLPPRWTPPQTIAFDLGGGDFPEQQPQSPEAPRATYRPSIPAALVIPNNIAVLHQFFAVAIVVTNGAPEGSSVVLDEISATIKTPPELRTTKSDPVVSFGQPVPIYGPNGVTALVAQVQGKAEYTLEGLKSGTHQIEVFVRGTLRSPNQADIPLSGKVTSAIVVHDPRFNITFSHPDTIRENLEYSAFAFVTNASPSEQTVVIRSEVRSCQDGYASNVCRTPTTPAEHPLTLRAGETKAIEYRLKSSITGFVYASAGSVNDEALQTSVRLTMGVSPTGVPLSPATLVMPHYAQPPFLDESLIELQLQLLGLGYSLATAPVTKSTAALPRVVKADVFQRAGDVARAGQRMFISDNRDAESTFANLALDLLGNGKNNDLGEWDQLRRSEESGRVAGAALARQIETHALAAPKSFETFIDHFAKATSHREPYVALLVYGPQAPGERPYALSIQGVSSGLRVDVPNEVEQVVNNQKVWIRQLPYADLSRLRDATRTGELLLIGNVGSSPEDLDVALNSATDGAISIEVIYPGSDGIKKLRATKNLTLTANGSFSFRIRRGVSIEGFETSSEIPLEPLAVLGARQDLFLDAGGRKVGVLFNRPIVQQENFHQRFSATATVAPRVTNVLDTFRLERNRPIGGAALQADGRIAVVNFDHSLHTNAAYKLRIAGVVEAAGGQPVTFSQPTAIAVGNNKPAAVLTGFVQKADGSAVVGSDVILRVAGVKQFDSAATGNGSFLFEYVPIDSYDLRAVAPEGKVTALEGAVRLNQHAYFVNLQFLGRGVAQGIVRYDNGEPVAGARVVVGSKLFNQFRSTTTQTDGSYSISDLPVGPLTFSATDSKGNTAYAASEIRAPGQLLVQDLGIFRQASPRRGIVRVAVKLSNGAVVPNAHVGIYTQGYGLDDGYTDSLGSFVFNNVPAGVVTLLAEEWSVARTAASQERDLAPDQVLDVTLILEPKSAEALARIDGTVHIIEPSSGAQRAVPNAIVRIDGFQSVTTDATGRFVYEAVPLSFGGKRVRAYDPATKKIGINTVPTLSAQGPNTLPITIQPSDTSGTGTVRVHLFDAAGRPVSSGVQVFQPGYPIIPLSTDPSRAGVYLLPNVPVGQSPQVWAVADGTTYGDQWAFGATQVEFDGHVANLVLRLPGEGTIKSEILIGASRQIGDVRISYLTFSHEEQGLMRVERKASTSVNGIADYATFTKIPAIGTITVDTLNHPAGYAKATTSLGYDGQIRATTLTLASLTHITGYVFEADEITPVPGATVRLTTSTANLGSMLTGPDGSFRFDGVAGNSSFRLIAEITRDGLYRIGSATGRISSRSNPVENVPVVLQKVGAIEGTIVRADHTPVAKAKFYARELDFPNRKFGSAEEPLEADLNGQFVLPNVFEGTIRVTAVDPIDETQRGDWTGRITFDLEVLEPTVVVGAAGRGTATITVVDPNNANQPVPSAEVALLSGESIFDFATTDGEGVATFLEIPVGTYSVEVVSKALGKSAKRVSFSIASGAIVPIEVSLVFSGTVQGTLTDPQPLPPKTVPGAHVNLAATGYSTRTTTDGDGDFVFNGVREGSFKLDARHPLSNRRATTTAVLTEANDGQPLVVDLQLERTGTLRVKAYLPDDAGLKSLTAPLPPASIEVTQSEFRRSAQGNDFEIPGMLRNRGYSVTVKELGGQNRIIRKSGTFPDADEQQLDLVFPAYGSVRVLVQQGNPGVPLANAKVIVRRGSTVTTLFTDESGIAAAHGIRLGEVTVQATSADNRLTASAVGSLTSQSSPLEMTIVLAEYASVTGYVGAEAGGPSTGSRVVATLDLAAGDKTLETLTDSAGRYTFTGIPNGTSIDFFYYGVDDIDIGARQSFTVPATAGTATLPLPDVKIDATPPLLLDFFPRDGAVSVSPDTDIKLIFSEAIPLNQITTSNLKLKLFSGTSTINTTFPSAAKEGSVFVVTMRPPAGTPFPLKSNTLYTVTVETSITDATGNHLPSKRAFSFTTSDYAKPKTVNVEPSKTTPIQAATTFRFTFSEPIKPASLQPTSVAFSKVLPTGGTEAVAGSVYLDAANVVVSFAPSAAIEEQTRYRIVISGLTDEQGNVMNAETHEWWSFDTVRPFVTVTGPSTATPLTSGIAYDLTVQLTNGSATGSAATDVSRVDFITLENGAEKFFKSTTAYPHTYRFTAPAVPAEGGIHTVKIVALDASGNVSDPVTTTWQVKANVAPLISEVTLTPSGSVYAGKTITAKTVFSDEGLTVTTTVVLVIKKTDGTTVHSETKSGSVSRANLTAAWPSKSFSFDLPKTLVGTETATFTSSVTDSKLLKSERTETLTILADAITPQVTIVSPVQDQAFDEGTQITVIANAIDAEVDVQTVTAQFEGESAVALQANPSKPGQFSGIVRVPGIYGSTILPKKLTVAAIDYAGNSNSSAILVNVKPVVNANAPAIVWICPSPGAMAPSGYATTLTAYITNIKPDTLPTFAEGEAMTPIAGAVTKRGDFYDIPYVTGGAPGSTVLLWVTAISPQNETTIERTTVEIVSGNVFTTNTTIAEGNTQFDNQTLIVQGGTTTIDGPHTFSKLIVLNGAKVTHSPTTSTKINALTLNATDVYVACGGSIDVNGRGFADVVNKIGRTWPGTTTGGSNNQAGGSHGGQGGVNGTASSSAQPYGSVFDPNTPGGAGGSDSPTSCSPCNGGGGVVRIASTKFVLDGAITANGVVNRTGGAGGSVKLDVANELSGSGQIRADGGAVSGGLVGGGGGRVALNFDIFGLDPANITALGGKIGSSSSARNAAAGTIYLKDVGQPFGDLSVSNESSASTVLSTQPTVLTSVGFRSIDALGADFVRSAGAQFPSGQLPGIRILPSGSTIDWRIKTNDAETLTLDVSTNSLTAAVGQAYRGRYRFDSVTLEKSTLDVLDLLDSVSLITMDTGSAIRGNNRSAPRIHPELISITTSALGPMLVGAPGAIEDEDPPFTIASLNRRTNVVTSMPANSDGSFVLGIDGEAGDVIAVRATDSNYYPLTSAYVDVATIAVASTPTTQVSSSGWTSDANFVPRSIELDGTTLVVSSRISGTTGSSDKAVFLDITSPAAPTFKRTVAIGAGPNRDLVASNGTLYGVSDRFWTLALNDPASTPKLASDPCTAGEESAVAVIGTHAFSGESGCDTRVVIYVYDVANPSTPLNLPLFVADSSRTPFAYTSFHQLGASSLIALSPSSPDNSEDYDVSIFNVANVSSIQILKHLRITNFQARRGFVAGTTLYLVDATNPEFVAVDVSNPATASVIGRVTLPTFGRGVTVSGTNAYVAADTAGVILVDVSNPAAMVVRGQSTTGGRAIDIVYTNEYLYIANELGVAVKRLNVSPKASGANEGDD